jgi:hypothetical protein
MAHSEVGAVQEKKEPPEPRHRSARRSLGMDLA